MAKESLAVSRSPEEELQAEIAAKIRFVEKPWRPFFASGLELVNDTEACNERLVAAGQPNLVIQDPVELIDIKNPRDMVLHGPVDTIYVTRRAMMKGNNYAASLILRGASGSITAEELKGMKDGTFTPPPSLRIPGKLRPSIRRLQNIPEFSQFTDDLLLDMSHGKLSELKLKHARRIFMLYQFERKLVDAHDEGVEVESGAVNERYLTR